MEKNALHVTDFIIFVLSLVGLAFDSLPSFCGGSIQKGLFEQLHWENKAGLPA